METPLRIIRAHVDNRCHNRPVPTDKQREREERIISTALTMMADFGGDTITMRKLAVTLRMSPATIRHHFIDIESILAEILFRHLTDIYRAIGKIPREHPTWRVAARGAYIEATRTFWGSFTEPHQLLLRARHTLPEDLAKPIAEMRTLIGQALAGEDAETAFTLLDAPHLDAADIEAMLAVRLAKDAPQTAAPKPAAPAKPAPPPTTPPHKRHYKNWKLERRLKSAKKNAARASPAPHDPPP